MVGTRPCRECAQSKGDDHAPLQVDWAQILLDVCVVSSEMSLMKLATLFCPGSRDDQLQMEKDIEVSWFTKGLDRWQ